MFVIPLLLLFGAGAFSQQKDTTALKAIYDRSIGFGEDKLDSLLYNANLIESESERLGFVKGRILSQRLRGIYSEYSGNYDQAISYYLSNLSDARMGNYVEYEISALSDLAILYSGIKQPAKAKDVYFEAIRLTEQRNEVSALVSGYSNLGALYNQLDMTDSALYFLDKALMLGRQANRNATLPIIYNNLGNVHFKKREFAKALEYFSSNRILHEGQKDSVSLWTDYLNIGDVFIEQKKYDSAYHYLSGSLKLAQELASKSKESESFALLAKLYSSSNDYRTAYEYQQKWYSLDTALVNETTGRTIAEMQEKFNARDRERKNQLLVSEVNQQKLQNRNLTILNVAAVIIGLLVFSLLLVYLKANRKLKKFNDEILRQKEKLALLNQEKNTLLSIVSHDLSAPFASIGMWSRLLEEVAPLQPDQVQAVRKIRDSASSGEKLIRQILEVEKLGTSLEKMELEEINLTGFVKYVAEEHSAIAAGKQINLITLLPPREVYLLTDQSLFRRIMDNLISNAIKFTPPGKQVRVGLSESADTVEFFVEDEGPGIPESERQLLFARYAQLSARPTGGEGSTGLGLAIVNRLVRELNGRVECDSVPDMGCRFRVYFKK